MLDLKLIRENPEKVKENTARKNEKADIDRILALDEKRRATIQEADELKNQRNVVSQEIAKLKKDKMDAADRIEAMKEVSQRIKSLDEELRETEQEMDYLLKTVPNMLHESVPVGKGEAENVIVHTHGTQKENIDKNHIDIAKMLRIIDFERGAKVSGAGFVYYVGLGARLERALINFMLDRHVENHGYTEMMMPYMVGRDAMTGTGQLPKMEEDMYRTEDDNLYMIPTAEVPLTNFHSGETLKDADLPIKFCGFSPCFRREAGSYGKEVHGFLRLHQFHKVELVKFVRPEDSWDELESLTREAEQILIDLGLPYRRLVLSSGDTSFASAKTYDLEVWSPGEQKWLEVSSCSNFVDFQARRANIRFKRDPKSKPEFVHTLNGSGLATPRIMVAILENYFEGERVRIPDVLLEYFPHQYI